MRLKAALAKHKEKRVAAKAEGSLDLDAKTRIAAKREFRIMATFEPAKFEALKKNVKLASLCAEVEKKLYTKQQRAQIRAELAALAAEDAEAADEMKKKLEFVAPEILMEEDMEKQHKHAHGSEDEKAQAEAEKAKASAEGEDEESKKAKAEADEKAKAEADEKAKAAVAAAPAAPAVAAPSILAAPVKAEADMSEDEKKAKAEADEKAKAAAPMMSDDEKAKAEAEKAKASEDCMPVGGETKAMQTEFLASLENLQGERVEMSLYGEESENPFWNLTVDSEPVGRIYLADQQDSASIKSSFVSDSYAQNFGNAIGKVGVSKMLELSKARLFAHEVDEAKITARLRDKARVEAKAEFEEKLGTIRKDFLSAVTLAMIGTDKNYFQGEGAHELKGGLFNALVQAGLESHHAVAAIEAGFEDAPAYWQFVMAKATELMDMPKEGREAIEKTVLASGKIEVAVQPEAGSEEQQIMDRLVKSSVEIVSKGGVVSGEHRKEIAARLGFAGKSR